MLKSLIVSFFVLATFLSGARADAVGEYDVNESGVYFYMPDGSSDDFISFSCESDPIFENQTVLIVNVPLTNEELRELTGGPSAFDKSYQGYWRYPAVRFDAYLSLHDVSDGLNHPILDRYIYQISSMTYSHDMNYDGEKVWNFSFRYIGNQRIEKEVFEYISNSNVVVRVNSWSRVIKEIPFPAEGKKNAFGKKLTPCMS